MVQESQDKMWSVISQMSEELQETTYKGDDSDRDEEQLKETYLFSLPSIPKGNEIPKNLEPTTPPPMAGILKPSSGKLFD